MKKSIRKFTFLKYSFFWIRTVTVNPKKFSWNTILDDIFLENFTLSNSIILVEDIIRWKKGFEIFLIDCNAGEIGNKNIAVKY